MKKYNNKGFSLPLAMGLVVVISMLAFAILEYMIPFSRDIKGVENSSNAYYMANSAIEEGLFEINNRNNSGAIDNKQEYSDTDFSNKFDYIYDTNSSGDKLPPEGEGDSDYDYDKNWNTISKGNSLQLDIGNGYLDLSSGNDDLIITIRVPDLNFDLNFDNEVLSGSTTAIINWQIFSKTKVLNAINTGSTKSTITPDQINNYNNSPFADGTYNNSITLNDLNGIDILGTAADLTTGFGTFYEDNCEGTLSGCTLKISVLNELVDNNRASAIPYLEWQMYLDTISNRTLPLKFTKLEASGKSVFYKKNLDVNISSDDVEQIFDYTIFQ